MHCSDLESYLEACLDGQLGEARRDALRRHLALCRPCSERVDELRLFEADLQRRLRAMQHEVSLWAPLGLEMTTEPVRESQPILFHPPVAQAGPVVPRPARAGQHRLRLGLARQRPAAVRRPVRRRLQTLAGAALMVAAVGAIVDLATGWLGGSRNIQLYRAYVAGDLVLDLRTGEPKELAAWLDRELGAPIELPAVAGFGLVGGSAELPGGPDSAAVVFAAEGVPVLLVIEPGANPADAAVAPPALAVEDGLTRLDWHEGAHAYSLVSALPPEKLALFAAP
ncbi:MAG: zf-HC2 domain-containing protein [Geminicoccaceae bacterium]|jgi:anti-sigma factor RsiW|nr:zf-HC2 domain-containing protein [Geminicoccaceae bacterium]HRY22861.1 zf-HC2 domain-containing protein [Geminicoccaceae bacterium]